MSPAVASAQGKRAKATNDYGYSNARLRGMRARLLRRERLENLLGLTDFPQLIQELMQTELQPFLEQTLIHGRNAASIDEALKLNLIETYRKVLGFLNTEADDICTTLLGRWDTFNLKTVLRGKHLHLKSAEIAEGLLPVGALTQVDLDGLSGQGDVKAVVDLAATWGLPQAAAMRTGFARYQESGELADLELAVDRFYADWASKRLARRKRNYQVARQVLGMQVDILNLVMIFRAARENLDAEQAADYFLLGGLNIELNQYQRLAAMSDVDEILDGLRGTPYGLLLDEAALRYLEDMSIAVFERTLEDHFTRKVIALGNRDPLGVGIPIGYLWAKQNEVTNLRIIVKGVAVGMPAERMRKELILV